MTTKPPSPVEPSPPESLEKIAYNSVESIPTEEPNDRNRLGYHVWRWLSSGAGTLEQAVAESGARIRIAQRDAVQKIREVLSASGVTPKG
jgi:hypothetical protein